LEHFSVVAELEIVMLSSQLPSSHLAATLIADMVLPLASPEE